MVAVDKLFGEFVDVIEWTDNSIDTMVDRFKRFQGKLGPRRAIVLVEEGCSEFSNIAGLSQIKFPKGDIAPVSRSFAACLKENTCCNAA